MKEEDDEIKKLRDGIEDALCNIRNALNTDLFFMRYAHMKQAERSLIEAKKRKRKTK
jgi:hypothetical protein